MKALLRSFIYSFLALYFTRHFVNGMTFGGDYNITLILVLIALTTLNLFLGPILKLMSLPQRGPANFFLRFMLTALIFFVLSYMLPAFQVHTATTPELILLGFVLNSRSLSNVGVLVVSSMLFTIIYSFLAWLGKGKGKGGTKN